MKIVALILAKGQSKRLPNKNKLNFDGKPMFMWNLDKCLKVFDKVYVSSDDYDILEAAEKVGAIAIHRGEELCGDVPNIPVYQHALAYMARTDKPDAIVAVQANSPTIPFRLIMNVKKIMNMGYKEIMTCHSDYSIYGSIWALNSKKLENYGDPYNPKPEFLIFDSSVDIHTQEDLEKALKQNHL